MRVLVALSGGVDSAVAALLLARAPGVSALAAVHMANWDAADEERGGYAAPACAHDGDWRSAEKTASILGVPLTRVSLAGAYWAAVFRPALDAYAAGRTPNPDVACNAAVKFGALWDWARERGFERLATGHYARIVGGRVAAALDAKRDQSYFLSTLSPDQIGTALFPLGEMTKDQVRLTAREGGLQHAAERRPSRGLCFVGCRSDSRAFARLLRDHGATSDVSAIEDETGVELGTCPAHLTVGQRARIGGLAAPYYVVGKSASCGTVRLSKNREHPALLAHQIAVRPSGALVLRPDTFVVVRSTDRVGARVVAIDALADRTVITTATPVRAPAPGQVAALYVRCGPDRVLFASAEII